jgi:hypothetical protein
VQEVDGGDDANAHLMESGSQMAGIPPVYNPEWADRRASGPTANTPPGAQAPSVHPTDATGRASGLPSVDSTNTAGWQTPREF